MDFKKKEVLTTNGLRHPPRGDFPENKDKKKRTGLLNRPQKKAELQATNYLLSGQGANAGF